MLDNDNKDNLFVSCHHNYLINIYFLIYESGGNKMILVSNPLRYAEYPEQSLFNIYLSSLNALNKKLSTEIICKNEFKGSLAMHCFFKNSVCVLFTINHINLMRAPTIGQK